MGAGRQQRARLLVRNEQQPLPVAPPLPTAASVQPAGLFPLPLLRWRRARCRTICGGRQAELNVGLAGRVDGRNSLLAATQSLPQLPQAWGVVARPGARHQAGGQHDRRDVCKRGKRGMGQLSERGGGPPPVHRLPACAWLTAQRLNATPSRGSGATRAAPHLHPG